MRKVQKSQNQKDTTCFGCNGEILSKSISYLITKDRDQIRLCPVCAAVSCSPDVYQSTLPITASHGNLRRRFKNLWHRESKIQARYTK